MAIRHDVMPAAGPAVEEMEQVVTLAVDAGLRIHAVIGDQNQRG